MARRPPLEVAQERAELARLRLAEFQQRRQLEVLKRAYDAAKPSQYHPKRGDKKSADAVMEHARGRLREQARYLDENSDIAIGVLDDLVTKVIGCGIGIEPQVTRPDGTLDEALNLQIRRAWQDWTGAKPEVRRDQPWGELQRQVARALYRDGEILIQHLQGPNADARHRGLVPYSIAVLESDFLPFDEAVKRARVSSDTRIVHGVEMTARGEALAFHLTRSHPGDFAYPFSNLVADLVRVPASQITHLKFVRRIGQTRGVTIFHGVLNRINQILDWDDSELTGAKVASAFTVAITRSADFATTTDVDTGKRTFELAPGMIFDNLLPGEGIETIGQNRPNAQYAPFRTESLRAVAAGTGTSYSSISRHYDGSYSSQRQELVESESMYDRLREYFISEFLREVYFRFLDMAEAAGVLDFTGVTPAARRQFQAIEPATPWIDPNKEADADLKLIKGGLRSRHQVIRQRGGDPAEVDRQIAADTFTQPAPEPAPNDTNGNNANGATDDENGKPAAAAA